MSKTNIEPIIEYINSLDERPSQAAVAKHMQCSTRTAARAFKASKYAKDRTHHKEEKIAAIAEFISNSSHRPTMRELINQFNIGNRFARKMLDRHGRDLVAKQTKFQMLSEYIDNCDERPSTSYLITIFDISDSYINLALKRSKFSGRKTKRVLEEKRAARKRPKPLETVKSELLAGDLSIRMMTRHW